MKSLFWGTLACLSLGILVPSAAAAQEYKWDMANDYPAESLPAQGDAHFVEGVKQRTSGRVVITAHFGGALQFTSSQMLDAIGSGALQIGDASSNFYGGVDPIFEMPSIPFFAASDEDIRTLFEVSRDEIEARMEKYGHKFLFATPWMASGIWARKPLNTLDALKGFKVRTYDANSSLTFQNVGAAPVQLSWGDVVPSLTTGAIDGVLTSSDGGIQAKFWELVGYFNAVNYANTLSIASMNLDLYNSLPKDIQEAILASAAETQARQWGNSAPRFERNAKIMNEHGITVVTDIDPALKDAFAGAAATLLQVWIDKMGPAGEELVARYRRAQRAR